VGLLATTRAVVPGMRKMRSGVVVNVGSIAGKMTYPLRTMYNGTKFAVEGISEALRFELREIGMAWTAMLADMDGEQYFANITTMFGL